MHRRVLCPAALLLGVLATLPGDVVGQSNQKAKPQPASQQEYYFIQNQKALSGQLLAFDDASHTASVRIDFPEWIPNPRYRPNVGAQHNLVNDYNRMMREQANMARSRNARQVQQHLNNMMNLQNRIAMDMVRAMNVNPNNMPFMQKHNIRDFDFDMEEKVVYRKMFLPQEYDDTGNLKKYSKEELAKLRGDNKPKGSYSATPEEIHAGQWVWIYLTPPKKAGSSSSSSSSAKDKDMDKAEKQSDLQDNGVPRPTVNKLVVHTDGTLPANSQTKNKGKKKKN